MKRQNFWPFGCRIRFIRWARKSTTTAVPIKSTAVGTQPSPLPDEPALVSRSPEWGWAAPAASAQAAVSCGRTGTGGGAGGENPTGSGSVVGGICAAAGVASTGGGGGGEPAELAAGRPPATRSARCGDCTAGAPTTTTVFSGSPATEPLGLKPYQFGSSRALTYHMHMMEARQAQSRSVYTQLEQLA